MQKGGMIGGNLSNHLLSGSDAEDADLFNFLGKKEMKDLGGKMKRKSVLVWMGFLLILCSLAFSQSKETGAITGTVLDEQNEPLP